MTSEPAPAELAAIAAAYAILRRARGTAENVAPVPRWRLAARVELADAADARVAARRSAWRSVLGP